MSPYLMTLTENIYKKIKLLYMPDEIMFIYIGVEDLEFLGVFGVDGVVVH